MIALLSTHSFYAHPVSTNIQQNKNIKQKYPLFRSPPLIGTISYSTFLQEDAADNIRTVHKTNDKHCISFTKKTEIKDNTLTEYNNIREIYLGSILKYIGVLLMVYLLLQFMISYKSFVKLNLTPIKCEKIKIRLSDLAGLEQAKLELQVLIDFIKQPDRYTAVGGKIPKGYLLVGSPGTGKTLLAKAVAGEAGVPFVSCSAPELIELFGRAGALKVRDLFSKACKAAPCIIFIDEIDIIGKIRGSTSYVGKIDEREQIINQLLIEMDGFKENSGVIVIAATKRLDILDHTLLQPGRFDRHITVELPNLHERVAILVFHTKNKPLNENVKLESIAKVTIGFSGADLENLANQAAILAAHDKRDLLCKNDFDRALDIVVLGMKNRYITSDANKMRVAYHEAGHALVAMKIGSYDTVSKVTILPRDKTMCKSSEDIESGLYTMEYLENQIVVALGGRAAEEVVYGKDLVTTGISNDLEKVQRIACMMVTAYGFSDKAGPIAWTINSRAEIHYSEYMLAQIDREIKLIANRCYTRAKNIILNNKEVLRKIAFKLIEIETLAYDELITLL